MDAVTRSESMATAVMRFKERRIVEAHEAMLKVLNGGEEHTVEQAVLFPKIQQAHKLLSMFRESLRETSQWDCVYNDELPYECRTISDVQCKRHTIRTQSTHHNEISVRATVQAPLQYTVLLLWAVQYIPKWCSYVKSAFVLKEIDEMSRFVMLDVQGSVNTLYQKRFAFAKMSIFEYESNGSSRILLLMEAMTDEELRPYKYVCGKTPIVHIRNLYIDLARVSGSRFDMTVIYSRALKTSAFSYVQDWLMVQSVVGEIYKLAVSTCNSALLGQDSVSFTDWKEQNSYFCSELNQKLLRGRRDERLKS